MKCPKCSEPFITEAESKWIKGRLDISRFCWLSHSLDGFYHLTTRWCYHCGFVKQIDLGKLGEL